MVNITYKSRPLTTVKLQKIKINLNKNYNISITRYFLAIKYNETII